jgi:hypothetical protein
MSKEVADLLRRAKEKIATPGTWTQEHYAKDENAEDVSPRDEQAICWCGFGALEAVTVGGPGSMFPENARLALAQASPGNNFVNFNDAPETTHDMVLAVFDKAIAAQESIP